MVFTKEQWDACMLHSRCKLWFKQQDKWWILAVGKKVIRAYDDNCWARFQSQTITLLVALIIGNWALIGWGRNSSIPWKERTLMLLIQQTAFLAGKVSTTRVCMDFSHVIELWEKANDYWPTSNKSKWLKFFVDFPSAVETGRFCHLKWIQASLSHL